MPFPDYTKMKRWRKRRTQGRTPTNISHRCTKMAVGRMECGVRC